ncbi:hypothetical protein COTS27_01134 [Spirochaetota bacterium]|nr:hypothetical protein COTS27_01134 [Spirochaetota bacterium]
MNLHPGQAQILETLFTTIIQRKNQLAAKSAPSDQNSYTQSLFKNGLKAIIAKVTEETNETIEAATILDQLTNHNTTHSISNKALPSTPSAFDKNAPLHHKKTPSHNDFVATEPTIPTHTSTQALTAAQAHLIHELADVLYHLFVLTAYSSIDLDDIKKELYKRHSG